MFRTVLFESVAPPAAAWAAALLTSVAFKAASLAASAAFRACLAAIRASKDERESLVSNNLLKTPFIVFAHRVFMSEPKVPRRLDPVTKVPATGPPKPAVKDDGETGRTSPLAAAAAADDDDDDDDDALVPVLEVTAVPHHHAEEKKDFITAPRVVFGMIIPLPVGVGSGGVESDAAATLVPAAVVVVPGLGLGPGPISRISEDPDPTTSSVGLGRATTAPGPKGS